MRVLYSGGTICSLETMKRLVLLADEIAFMDRPSVKFENFGTVGQESEFRQAQIESTPISFSVHSPSDGPARDLYRQYIQTDLKDANFIRIVIDALKSDDTFRHRLVQLDANYGWGTGRQVLNEILKDGTLYEGEYECPSNPQLLYVPDTAFGRRQTLGVLLIEASIQLTNALIVAEATSLTPISDDPYFCHLLAYRTSSVNCLYKPDSAASLLGLAITTAVIPDEALAHLTLKDLFEFRKSAIETYAAWSVEVECLAQKLLDVPTEQFNSQAAKLLITEVRPRMVELQRGLAVSRDKLFGDLVKSVLNWRVPTFTLAYMSTQSIPVVLGAFAATLVPALNNVVDHYLKRRDLVRNNSMAYLIGLSELSAADRH